MTPEEWHRTKEIFERAVTFGDQSEQQAYIETACGRDGELRAHVNALLRPTCGVLDRFESLPGRFLGHYEVLERIGEGTAGVVYGARDTRLARVVAIKILPPQRCVDREAIARFRQEALCLAALNHPHIVTIHALEELPDAVFIVMENIPGTTLAERLVGKPLALPEALAYARQLASALAAAHTEKIVHRDLNPSNILVTQRKLLKVVDFGIAKILSHPLGGETARTRQGTIIGTADYMSPEQARGLPADERSDIFSFGIVLFEMLTGVRPFHRGSVVETMAAVLKDEPAAYGRHIPQEIAAVVSRCLQKDPRDRFQTASDICRELGTHNRDEKPPLWAILLTAVAAATALAVGYWILNSSRLPLRIAPPTPVQVSLAEQFEQAMAAQRHPMLTKCWNDPSGRCDLKSAAADLQQSGLLFDAILQTHPYHAASLWNGGLAWSALCKVAEELGDFTNAQRACDRAIDDFREALGRAVIYPGLPTSIPDEGGVCLNLAYTLALRGRLPGVDTRTRAKYLLKALAEYDRLLAGGPRVERLMDARRAEVQTARDDVAEELKSLSPSIQSRGR